MIALVQRVREARVEVAGRVTGAIGPGLLVFVCAEPADGATQVDKLVDKLVKLRIFADAEGKMNRSLLDVGGQMLVVSQFTLAADTHGGNRPSFAAAAPPALGRALYEQTLAAVRERLGTVQAGEFGAGMQVHLVNDGPVTIPITLR